MKNTLFSRGNPYSIVSTTNSTYNASIGEFIITEGSEVILPSPSSNEVVVVRSPISSTVDVKASSDEVQGNTDGIRQPAGRQVTYVADGDDWYVRNNIDYIGLNIPDSVVSRDDDDNTLSNSDEFGFAISPTSYWPDIGARISSNTSGLTKAYLRDNNGNGIQSVDISNLSAGDTFTFEGVNLQSGSDYRIVADAEGSSYTVGYFSGTASYPYTSNDVDIIKRVRNGSVNESNPANINDIGNPGGVLG